MAKRYYPEKFNLVTNADDAALILDIERIPGESLSEYKKRVMEGSSNISNSSYEGLINGINRELGLKQFEAIEISFKEILCGDLFEENNVNTDYVITDNRLYVGLINGSSIRITENKIQFSSNTWKENYLIGLSFFIENKEYKIISNTVNEISVDSEFESLHLNKEYTIKPNWKTNQYLNYILVLENEPYPISGNTEKTITLSKPLSYRTSGFYKLRLSRPKVKITSSRVIFYLDYLNEKSFRLELEVDLRDGNISHSDLCEKVNKESKFYFLKNLIPLENSVKAFTLKQKDSDIKVFQEVVPASKFFKLKNANVKPGTLKFSESNIFGIEEDVLPENLNGPYYSVNQLEGTIKTKTLPSGAGQVSYIYMDFPFVLESAPAVVLSFSDKESEKFLFSQKEKLIYEDSRDRFVSSQPKTEMIEYISELLKINKQSWGA